MPDIAPSTATEIRELYGQPDPKVYAKQLPRLDRHARAFIELSPFLVLASADAEGHCDATPRGDAPGFVVVLDDAVLAIPDRIGNKRVDTMLNVAANPQVGLIFFVPGINESLRVNGRASISQAPDLLDAMAVHGKQPLAALVVEIEEVFFHCGKALIRSDLWNPEKKVPRASFPTLGRILADQISQGQGVEESDKWIAEAYVKRLY
jgi:hypothetical protein